MNSLSAIIIEDEEKSRNLLQELVRKHCPKVKITGVAADGFEGIKLIRKHKPDFIFLDIQMPKMNGFQMLEVYGDFDFDIVFITAYDQYAIKAIRFSAFDYLLKPIDVEDLKSTVERLKEKGKRTAVSERNHHLLSNIQNPAKKVTKITISSNDGIYVIAIADIIFMEADGQYTTFHLKGNDKRISSINLKEYEDLFAGQNFFRVHHSFLINMNEIKKYVRGEGGTVIMSNGKEVDVSKRRKAEFMQLLKSF